MIFDEQGNRNWVMKSSSIVKYTKAGGVVLVVSKMVNLSVLRSDDIFVDIHGQHDQEELMRHNCIFRCDGFGDADFLELKKVYQTNFDAYQ